MTDTDSYPDVVNRLMADRVMPLGPGEPHLAVRQTLKALTVSQMFEGHRVRDTDMANACLAGLWLYHDFLEESHTISQGIETVTGSYWHGIMHRREPDDENAKYWFRRVGRHPVYEALQPEAIKLGMAGRWDPIVFVDLYSMARSGKINATSCRDAQTAEWRALFEFCYRSAI